MTELIADCAHADPRRKEPVPYLHIYPQESYHSEASIVGNLQGLVCLIKSVAAVLHWAGKKDHAESEIVFCSDGEGYTVNLIRLDDPSDHKEPWGKGVALPYAELLADKEDDIEHLRPWDLWIKAVDGQLNSPVKESDGNSGGGVRVGPGGGDSEPQVQEQPNA